MKIIETRRPSEAEKKTIYRLWNEEYPRQLMYTAAGELDTYLDNLTDQRHYFAVDTNEHIIGWAFTFERSAEKWFAIIVASSDHEKGVGSLLLNALKQNETMLNGWVTDHDRYLKQDGSPYPSPLAFYLKNGFTVCEGIRLEIEKLSAAKITWSAK